MNDSKPDLDMIGKFHELANGIQNELSKMMVGQKVLLHDLVVTLLAGGHALLEGVPGLGKTMLIRTLSEVINCTYNRVQFTPDLMPADIVGTVIITENVEGRRGFRFEKGPIFANLLLADEINRATPRTQSALLEAMQERRVTVAGQNYLLPAPFFVLATQNPIEMEGTYPLPEAQLDRFFYKIEVPYPSEDELIEIARRTTGAQLPVVGVVADGPTLTQIQQLVKEVPVEERVYRYAARLVMATHPAEAYDTRPSRANGHVPDSVRRNVRVGASPRGIQTLIWAGKVEALLDNRKAVSIDDIRKVIYPALRHRLILNFEAQAEGIPADTILEDVLKSVEVP
jgi:MoxR-like ATPase